MGGWVFATSSVSTRVLVAESLTSTILSGFNVSDAGARSEESWGVGGALVETHR
jgi:hypothetical protein